MSVRNTIAAAAFVTGAACAGLVSAEPVKEVLNPETLVDPTSYGFAHANVVPAGSRLVYVAGQVGVDGTKANDFRSQVDRAFENLLIVLKASGSGAENVVRITLLIKDHDPDKLRYVAEKRRAIFGEAPPASTLIPVTRLYGDGVSFEIDAVAVVNPSVN